MNIFQHQALLLKSTVLYAINGTEFTEKEYYQKVLSALWRINTQLHKKRIVMQ